MADQSDVRRVALSIPGTSEAEDRFAFSVHNKGKQKGLAWVWAERVQPKKPRVPRSDVVAVRVANQHEKEALLAADDAKFFTEPHYNGFPAVLVRLPAIDADELAELIMAAAAAATPKELDDVREAVELIASGKVAKASSASAPTVEAFAKEWTSGKLRKAHPERKHKAVNLDARSHPEQKRFESRRATDVILRSSRRRKACSSKPVRRGCRQTGFA